MLKKMILEGVWAGLLGGTTIWLYELVVWVHLLHIRTLRTMVENTAALVFGDKIRELDPLLRLILSTAIHYATAIIWAVLFAAIWPFLRARRIEATLAALFYGIFAWVIMHNVVLATLSPAPPEYTVYSVLNGFMSHTFGFAVPLALLIKARRRV